MTAPVQVGPPTSGPTAVPDWEEELADIGDRIRAERQGRGWTQEDLARYAGMDQPTVKRMEAGACTLRTFVRACWALGVSMDRLLADDWQMPVKRLTLTARQAQVLETVADGRPLSTAARDLGMTREGLSSVLTAVYRRLGVTQVPRGPQRRAAAVQVAVRHGILASQIRAS